jgi:hypothetical protein
MKKIILKILAILRYPANKVNTETNSNLPDIKETEFWEIYNLCHPYTMTSIERMYALYCSVNYILSNDIKGAFVECGVWRGGSSMMIANMLSNRKIVDREIYLYDTFEGMSEPSIKDIDINGEKASKLLKINKNDKENTIWCLANIEDVKTNMRLTNFPLENLKFIKGKVEETIPYEIPNGNIALLRLDTDWYESTKHELYHLFPKLEKNGILIIDDYGHWQGCKKAVDEYFYENRINILLNRVDYTGRVGIKTSFISD